ncbi:hypothetical protein O3P69_002338 [Scylla paramamosain]|uniref:Uncharacterized protein n=1 Tax=Scylla paramamosain TaxID=85552 RepID=A0AAW0V8B1_SCYPA
MAASPSGSSIKYSSEQARRKTTGGCAVLTGAGGGESGLGGERCPGVLMNSQITSGVLGCPASRAPWEQGGGTDGKTKGADNSSGDSIKTTSVFIADNPINESSMPAAGLHDNDVENPEQEENETPDLSLLINPIFYAHGIDTAGLRSVRALVWSGMLWKVLCRVGDNTAKSRHLYPNDPVISTPSSLPPRQHPKAWERNEEVQFGAFTVHTSPFDQHLIAPRVRPTFMAAKCQLRSERSEVIPSPRRPVVTHDLIMTVKSSRSKWPDCDQASEGEAVSRWVSHTASETTVQGPSAADVCGLGLRLDTSLHRSVSAKRVNPWQYEISRCHFRDAPLNQTPEPVKWTDGRGEAEGRCLWFGRAKGHATGLFPITANYCPQLLQETSRALTASLYRLTCMALTRQIEQQANNKRDNRQHTLRCPSYPRTIQANINPTPHHRHHITSNLPRKPHLNLVRNLTPTRAWNTSSSSSSSSTSSSCLSTATLPPPPLPPPTPAPPSPPAIGWRLIPRPMGDSDLIECRPIGEQLTPYVEIPWVCDPWGGLNTRQGTQREQGQS